MAFDPTASEQELMQLANRFRTDPQHEFSRLMVSASPRIARDANVDFSLNFFNSNMTIVQQEIAALTPVPPIAWDALSQQVAQDYLPLMAAAKSSSHSLSGSYQERIGRYAFDTSKGISARENLSYTARLIGLALLAPAGAAYAVEEPAQQRELSHEAELCIETLEKGGEPSACQEAPSPIAPALNELIWGALAFITVFVLLSKFAYPAIRKAMEEAIASRKPTLINAVIDETAGTESGRITSLNPTAGKKK